MPRSVTVVQPALANWKPNAVSAQEIVFVVSRVVLQDFTGVPLLADLAAIFQGVCYGKRLHHGPA